MLPVRYSLYQICIVKSNRPDHNQIEAQVAAHPFFWRPEGDSQGGRLGELASPKRTETDQFTTCIEGRVHRANGWSGEPASE